jgi:hypothetical protein
VPPTTSTFPFGNPDLGTDIAATPCQVFAATLKSSAEATIAGDPPPTTRSLPSNRSVAVWPPRAAARELAGALRGYKGGQRTLLRAIARLLREQARSLAE